MIKPQVIFSQGVFCWQELALPEPFTSLPCPHAFNTPDVLLISNQHKAHSKASRLECVGFFCRNSEITKKKKSLSPICNVSESLHSPFSASNIVLMSDKAVLVDFGLTVQMTEDMYTPRDLRGTEVRKNKNKTLTQPYRIQAQASFEHSLFLLLLPRIKLDECLLEKSAGVLFLTRARFPPSHKFLTNSSINLSALVCPFVTLF